jgi:hypothetical protein
MHLETAWAYGRGSGAAWAVPVLVGVLDPAGVEGAVMFPGRADGPTVHVADAPTTWGLLAPWLDATSTSLAEMAAGATPTLQPEFPSNE